MRVDETLVLVEGCQEHTNYTCLIPFDLTPEQLFGKAFSDYEAFRLQAYYSSEKERVVTDFVDLINPKISYSPQNPTAPIDLNFSVSGEILSELNIISYTWDFGDNKFGFGQTVSHIYRQPGTYPVKLTLTDSNNIPHEITENIVVRPPEIDVSYPHGFDSHHRGFSTPVSPFINQYLWDFDDRNQTGEDRIIEDHEYPEISKYYTVTLTLTLDEGPPITSQEGIWVGPGPRLIPGHTIYGDETWYHDGGTYVVQGSITVAQGGRLTIEDGTRVELYGGVQIAVNGILNAIGETSHKITFTWADGANQWRGFRFEGAGSSASRLENCVIEHASGRYVECPYYCYDNYDRGIIYLNQSSPTITGCTINNSGAVNGIGIVSGSPVISNNTISGMGSSGLYVVSNANPTVTGNTITGNGTGISIDNTSSGTYQGNTITGNISYGLYYTGNTDIDAINTYWGDASGPLDDSDDRATGGLYNPDGQGDRVSDYVNYSPWTLIGPSTTTTTTIPLNTTTTSVAVSTTTTITPDSTTSTIESTTTTTVETTTSTTILTTSTTTFLNDSDGDGIPDAEDNCPNKPNGPDLGTCMADSDKAGSSCSSDADCVIGCSTNGICGMTQDDADNDGVGDVCDNCPTDCNSEQKDANNNGIGDVCDTDPGCGGCSGIQCEQQC